MKFVKNMTFQGSILCRTNLHIGGTKESAEFGEIDNPIIRNPLSYLPYIPGSSLKGKMRSLLERIYSPQTQKYGFPCYCGSCAICVLFGKGLTRDKNDNDTPKRNETGPTRLIFRDALLSRDYSKEQLSTLLNPDECVKTEVVMDRNKNTVSKIGGPRPVEFVPEGVKFDFEVVLQVFQEDEENLHDYLEIIAEGFKLLEDNYLGGCGSRGYGKVEVHHIDDKGETKPMHEYLHELSDGLKANSK